VGYCAGEVGIEVLGVYAVGDELAEGHGGGHDPDVGDVGG
jgi:hypothetical protein